MDRGEIRIWGNVAAVLQDDGFYILGHSETGDEYMLSGPLNGEAAISLLKAVYQAGYEDYRTINELNEIFDAVFQENPVVDPI